MFDENWRDHGVVDFKAWIVEREREREHWEVYVDGLDGMINHQCESGRETNLE